MIFLSENYLISVAGEGLQFPQACTPITLPHWISLNCACNCDDDKNNSLLFCFPPCLVSRDKETFDVV